MTEQQYQKKIIDEYRKKNYYVLKLIKTNLNGIPDLLCLKPNEPALFIEVKTSKGVLSKLQKYRIDEINNFGLKAKVIYGLSNNL